MLPSMYSKFLYQILRPKSLCVRFKDSRRVVTPFFGCAGANRLRSEKEVEEALVHELIHAYDVSPIFLWPI